MPPVLRTVAFVALVLAVCPGRARAADAGGAVARDGGPDGGAEPSRPEVVVTAFDDGLRVPGNPATPLPKSPFPGASVELFALRGETVAFQVVVERRDAGSTRAHAVTSGLPGVRATTFAEDFLVVERTSGNDENGDVSLAFTPRAKPSPAMLGPFADALVPDGEIVVSRERRAAVWIDVEVPEGAAPALLEGRVAIVAEGAVVGEVAVNLRVVDRALPYAALPVMVYYEPEALSRRMGGLAAEPALRRLFHAHHVAAIRPVLTERDLEAEIPWLTGEGYTPAAGYEGPGRGRGEGIVVLGSYGDLGPPAASKVPLVENLYRRVRALGPATETFLYAVDEECKSPWPAAWRALLDKSADARSLRIGATCGDAPERHPADIVIQLSEDLSGARIEAARAAGKSAWAYNGRRPFSGAPVVDAPATDLRANGWIAARYGVERWFYWEATSWTSYGGGKIGGDTDPFVVADSFHNKDRDHSNGDGILVYPGRQVVAGMRSYDRDEVFPSVRFKNLRRGIEDVGYVRLARAIAKDRVDAIVSRRVPFALADARADAPPAFSDEALPWLEARRELLSIVLEGPAAAPLPIAPPPLPVVTPPAAPRGAVALAVLGLSLAIAGAATRVHKVRE